MPIYFGAVAVAAALAQAFPGTAALEAAIIPALAVMLFVTFLQVPLGDLGLAFARWRFMATLLAANFLAIPLLAAVLAQLLPPDPLIRLGALLVLLTPCVDYVVTFAHLGRADAKPLLAATPALLLLQMALLPVYLGLLLDEDAARLVQVGPFVHAFLWLIAVPLALAGLVQLWARRTAGGARAASVLGVLPVPATAVVLFAVVAAVVPRLGQALDAVLTVVPVYVLFALLAPLVGWGVARLSGLRAGEARAVAFSAATRNSLVVLPLALSVPGALPVLPAIIVAQTLVELIGELIYIRTIPRLGQPRRPSLNPPPLSRFSKPGRWQRRVTRGAAAGAAGRGAGPPS
ncbi:arsenic resistance protein [Roseicella aerolata]|uniref:Arsenic resistance protein n=1 Tax=Roseicella aerolata TaxID=2883479 RepID=A0A9X1IF78_9PROT|nr:arsenic resistance protein [Roseicella aerolata]